MLGIIGAQLAQARTVDAVLNVVAESAMRVIPSRGHAIYRLDPQLQPTATVARDLSPRFLSDYERHGRADDALMVKLTQRQTAVTDLDCKVESTVCSQWGLGRFLIVPLFDAHGISGTINFVRPLGAPAFPAQAQLSALAMAAQVSLAIMRCEDAAPRECMSALTHNEQELLRYLAKGLSNREIAQQRRVSEHAVHQALRRLYRKLGVHSRAAAVAVSLRSSRV